MSKTVIIHHGNCADGYGSAWLLSKYVKPDLVIPALYSDPLPREEIRGADVYILDFSYKKDVLNEIIDLTNSCLILDHHKTAVHEVMDSDFVDYRKVEYLPHNRVEAYTHRAVIDESRSGVGLTMELVNDFSYLFLATIEDRDLWKFALEDTEELFGAIISYPMTTEVWDEIAEKTKGDLLDEARAIYRYRQKLISEILPTAAEKVIPTGDKVWVASSPYAVGSDVAGELAKRTPNGYAAYVIYKPNEVQYGLRSVKETGMDVSLIAERFGGGGHKNAAGFIVDWETYLDYEKGNW